MELNPKFIRNFSIIAHIDHGKSTLADRLIENTNTIKTKKVTNQYLDSLELEKKRGITIKLNYIQLHYKSSDGNTYFLNMIDTPGHVDFTYEVSRSLAACEGAILIIDASKGIQAQTLSNIDLALQNNLEIFPVINKIDLQHANIKRVTNEIKNIIGFNENEITKISAKNNLNIDEIFERIIKQIPPPKKLSNSPLKCLIFDSYYDTYKGALIYIKVVEGAIKLNDDIYFYHSNTHHNVRDLYIKRENLENVSKIEAGNVGIINCGLKDFSKVKIGDTITHTKTKNIIPLPGYINVLRVVFSSFYPIDNNDYDKLLSAIKKIKLTDDSIVFEPETSSTLGYGIRCGFLGGLHLEVIKERLEIEYNLDIIVALPSVKYEVYLKSGSKISINNPCDLPEISKIEKICEPYCNLIVICPNEYYGKILEYTIKKRGVYKSNSLLDESNKLIYFDIPLAELIVNYFDVIKSISKGYATIDYHYNEYRESKLIRLDVKLNNQIIEPLTSIIYYKNAYNKGRWLCENIKELLPKHSFEIPVQAFVGSKVIARETVKATRKDVTAKLYGGDVSRKKKLLEKQKKGKKRMKRFGKVNVPQNIFIKLTKINKN